MSFNWDPFKVTTIVRKKDGFVYSCDSCGKVSSVETNDLKQLWQAWLSHVSVSHAMTTRDTEGWTTP